MGQYRTYPAKFKAETVIESLRGQKSDAQICRERGIAPDLLSRWRQHFLERAERLFASDQARSWTRCTCTSGCTRHWAT